MPILHSNQTLTNSISISLTNNIYLAGGLVVHTTSGFSGLAVFYLVGPRITKDAYRDSRRAKGSEIEFNQLAAHNIVFVLLGTFFIWVTWFSFNAGSAIDVTANQLSFEFAIANLNTMITPVSAVFMNMLLDFINVHIISVIGMSEAIIAGLVFITPMCSLVQPFVALFGGVLASLLAYFTTIHLKNYMNKGKNNNTYATFDDTLDIFFVHGIVGFFASILTGVFVMPQFGGYAGNTTSDLIFPNIPPNDIVPGGYQIVIQIVAAVIVSLWAFIFSAVSIKVTDLAFGGKWNTMMCAACRYNPEVYDHPDQAYLGENCYNFVSKKESSLVHQVVPMRRYQSLMNDRKPKAIRLASSDSNG